MRKYAFVSVVNEDKNPSLVNFIRLILGLGWEIISTGGTAKFLREHECVVTELEDYTGGGSVFGGRVKSLSRELAMALLSRDDDADRADLVAAGMPEISMVVCSFYKLHAAIAASDATVESVTEKIDIGGPTMCSEASKGNRIVVCDLADLDRIGQELMKNGDIDSEFRLHLRAKADVVVAEYRLTSARFLGKGEFEGIIGQRVLVPSYGENRYMVPTALYSTGTPDPLSIANFKAVAGADPSFNNILDIDRLLQAITHIAAVFWVNFKLTPFIACAVKHGNICGAGVAGSPREAIQKMIDGDPRAIFGGLVMVNFPITEELAEVLHTHGKPRNDRHFYDGVIASNFDEAAIGLLKRKKDKCRFIANEALGFLSEKSLDVSRRIRPVRGGFLAQPNYTFVLDLNREDLQVYGERNKELEDDLLLAWAVCATSNSNTITLAHKGKIIGNGVAQQDRVGAAELAIKRARDSRHVTFGSSAVSDSFFPFPDAVAVLIAAGVKLLFSTSGSINDGLVQDICLAAGTTLYQLPDAEARIFFGH